MKNQLLLFVATALVSACAVKQKAIDTKITQQQATSIIERLAGKEKPERSLYHTYEGTTQMKSWWKKEGTSTYTYKETITLTKQEGNYVEGRINYDYNGSIGSFPVFGRFNFTHLYLFNASPSAQWPELREYRIDQNGRILFKTKTASKNANNASISYGSSVGLFSGSLPSIQQVSTANGLVWKSEPRYDVDLFPYDKKHNEIWTSTGLISKTDDYISDENRSTNPTVKGSSMSSSQSPSLTDKLKELKKLYNEGLITKEEYEQARKKALEE